MSLEINRGSGIHKKETLVKLDPSARGATSFEQTLSVKRLTGGAEVLAGLISQIDDQAKRLSESRTIRDLQIYKKYVQSFLQHAVQFGLETEQSRSWQQGGVQQTLVQTVNQKLITLTDDMLHKHKRTLDLLQCLDEIRGMLVNLSV